VPYLRVLGHVENIWPLTVWLYRERGILKPVEGMKGVSRARVMSAVHKPPEKWTTLRNIITAARRIAERGEVELLTVDIEQLDAHAYIPWTTGPDEFAVHIGIIPHPLAMIYAGNEGMSVQFGQVVAHSTKERHSATNSGEGPRVHLVLTLRQRVIEEEPT
jgi:hypothetical protein